MMRELMATAALFTAISGLPVEAQTVAPMDPSPQTREQAAGDQNLSPVQELPDPAAPARLSEGEKPFPQQARQGWH